MRARRWVQPGLLAALVIAQASFCTAEPGSADAPVDIAAMRQRVDELLARNWQQNGVQPAEAASDSEFLRRASLDLTGRLPSIHEARAFLADASPDKRLRLIDRLVEKPSHATHLANVWTSFLLPRTNNNAQFYGGPLTFQNWLRGKFAENEPYDKAVRELIFARGQLSPTTPAMFYIAHEFKPEELAASVSRAFLGVQIQCAQCHQHPFDAWSQRDFWGFAAFFAQIRGADGQRAGSYELSDTQRGDVRLPGTDEIVPPRALLASSPMSPMEGISRRRQLADWLVSADNPYFARAAVNRVWALLFGRGLVHPVDDFSERHPPSHPELLDDLSQFFVRSNFDLRLLVRTLVGTQAYGLSSGGTGQAPLGSFARMAIKPLTAEQLYDCLADATLRRQGNTTNPAAASFAPETQARQQFLAKFHGAGAAADEYQGGIPQALTLMNGALMAEATDPARSDILVELRAPYFNDVDRLEIVYLAALSRYPAESERSALLQHLESQPSSAARQKALGDIVWALVNSAEFALNH